MNNILITGSTGFLGMALTKALKMDPNNIIVTIERDKTHERPSISNHCVRGDILNFDLVKYLANMLRMPVLATLTYGLVALGGVVLFLHLFGVCLFGGMKR